MSFIQFYLFCSFLVNWVNWGKGIPNWDIVSEITNYHIEHCSTSDMWSSSTSFNKSVIQIVFPVLVLYLLDACDNPGTWIMCKIPYMSWHISGRLALILYS